MQKVIDIDEEVYERILKAKSIPDLLGTDIVNVVNAVKNGKPLQNNKSNVPKLKPCPFCGTEVKMQKKPLWHGNHGYHDCYNFEVKCPKCGCSVDYIDSDTIYRSEEEAVVNVTKAWNSRKEN